MLDLAFQPDRTQPTPVYRQVADHLRDLIALGRLKPGERLPPTRALATGLGIGRKTATGVSPPPREVASSDRALSPRGWMDMRAVV